jgi:hypothetical protein
MITDRTPLIIIDHLHRLERLLSLAHKEIVVLGKNGVAVIQDEGHVGV